MILYIDNHSFHYELENLIRVFYPNEKIIRVYDESLIDSNPCIKTIYEEITPNKTAKLTVSAVFSDYSRTVNKTVVKDWRDFDELCELTFAQIIIELLASYTKITLPWGVLTGVRPVKLFRNFCEKLGEKETKKYFADEFYVTEEKIDLAVETERNEKTILNLSKPNSFSLYVSIPFCPSRCSYCSFVSQATQKAKHLIEPYVELLCKELEDTANHAQNLNLRLETVYIGGGTPTTLSPIQLEKIIKTIYKNFNMTTCREFTVEAGRPDTITEDKLKALFKNGVNRISINPQSMNNKTLETIGRNHTEEETLKAFELARKTGFTHINMDLIAGLPGENYRDFKYTINKVTKLQPESVTLHTLSMKKASTLTEQGMKLYKEDSKNASMMHTLCKEELKKEGLVPYYLYRQSRMVGNLENIGYAKTENFGLYNVFIMDETHSILACGAGAVTKLKSPSTPYLERIFNYKYPYEYINQFEEIINRKEKYQPFYESFI